MIFLSSLILISKLSPGCGIPARLKVFVTPKHEDFSMILRPGLGTTSCRSLRWWRNHLEFLRAQILSTGNYILFSLWWGALLLPPPAPSLNPALGACCSGNSWNIMNECLLIQEHRKTLRATLFLFNNCACFPIYWGMLSARGWNRCWQLYPLYSDAVFR